MQVSINSTTQNTGNRVTDGNYGDIIVSQDGTKWTINSQQINDRFVINEELTGIDGSKASFTTNYNFVPGSLTVFTNGLKQYNTKDYITTSTNTFVFYISPTPNDSITVNYTKA